VRRLSFKGNGVIGECRARLGQAVRKGEVLLALRNQEERAALAVAEKDLALARAQRAKVLCGLNRFQIEAKEHNVTLLRERLAHAQREGRRARRLAVARAASDEEHQRAETVLRQAETALRQAEADLRQARNHVTPEDRQVAEAQVEVAAARLEWRRRQLEETLLRAPCDGQVLEVCKREGDAVRLVDTGAALLFADVSRLRVRAEIEDRFVSRLRAGQRAVLCGRGLGGEVAGRVVQVKGVMGRKTVFTEAPTERRDLEVIEVFIEPEGTFRAPVGLRVDVKVRLES
jgi:multidrug resistance efflux pump